MPAMTFKHRNMRGAPYRNDCISREMDGPCVSFVEAATITLAELCDRKERTFYAVGSCVDLMSRLRSEAKRSRRKVKIDARKIRDAFTVTLPDDTWFNVNPASIWFDRLGETETVDDVWDGWERLVYRLADCTVNADGKFVELRSTPAQTGLDIFRTYMPGEAQFVRLDSDSRNIIMSPSSPERRSIERRHGADQHRIETYKKRGHGFEYFYYDHHRFYEKVATAVKLPIGYFTHEITSEYVPYEPAWYLIKARVPDDWNHIGLVQCDGEWMREPGKEFTGWFAEPEARLLMMPERRATYRDQSLPRVNQDWQPQVLECLYPDCLGKRAPEGLRNAVNIIRDVERSGNGDPFIKAACRHILLDAIGTLHPSVSNITSTISEDEFDPDDFEEMNVSFSRDATGNIIVKSNDEFESRTEAPQLTSILWSQARTRITLEMLSLPFETIVGCWGDAICTTAPYESAFYKAKGQRSPIRLKGHIEGKFNYPKSISEFVALNERAQAEFEALRSLETEDM